jgi:nitroreductase
MDTFECITTKLEVREFSTQDVSSEIRSKILEAARLTGTSMNTQHWRFILVEKRDKLDCRCQFCSNSTNKSKVWFSFN